MGEWWVALAAPLALALAATAAEAPRLSGEVLPCAAFCCCWCCSKVARGAQRTRSIQGVDFGEGGASDVARTTTMQFQGGVFPRAQRFAETVKGGVGQEKLRKRAWV